VLPLGGHLPDLSSGSLIVLVWPPTLSFTLAVMWLVFSFRTVLTSGEQILPATGETAE
jgi:hypothetical protein